MKKILVTGGPVSTQLDAVKIITNRFRGGLMQALAHDLADQGHEVTYLAEDAQAFEILERVPETNVVHEGFRDYHDKVMQLAPQMDAVILGAAVANLMPLKPWKDKFPSHNYKPGDVIPIEFILTPRIIDEVKKVAPRTHLFGFKLLANADHEELIRAAYEIVLSAHCTAVFANDRTDLSRVFAVTKERAVHPMDRKSLAKWINQALDDEYYRTEFIRSELSVTDLERSRQRITNLLDRYGSSFSPVEGGMVFGTVACQLGGGFITTSRGKKELRDFVIVKHVNHRHRVIQVVGREKATLNAPLLDSVFSQNARVDSIVHFHKQDPTLPTVPYAPPGTARDSIRGSLTGEVTSFNIAHHGCFLLLDKNGKQL